MAFAPAFGRPFAPTFDRHAAAAATGWWVVAGKTCVAAYQPKGAADLATSYVNLANPGTYDAAPGVAPTWASATGWTGDAATMYLTTGITVASASWSVLIRQSNIPNGAVLPFGSRDSLDRRFTILGNFGGTIYYEYGAATTGWLAISASISSGVLGMAGAKCYRNGVEELGAISAVAVSTLPIVLLAWNNEGSIGGSTSASIQAFAIYSGVLSAVQMATVSAAMAAL